MAQPMTGSAAAELRAHWGCRQLEALGLRAEPAYDEAGRVTGLVAIDADDFADWLTDYVNDLEGEDG